MSEGFPDPTEIDRIFESDPDVTGSRARAPKEQEFRWGAGLIILVAGVAAELVVWNYIGQDRTHQVMYSLPIVSGVPFFLLVWWIFFSGIDWATRALGIGAVLSVVALFFSRYRFDGFEGDMIPRFTKRSEPTAEMRLAKFLKSQRPEESIGHAESVGVSVSARADASREAASLAAKWVVAETLDWGQYRGPFRDGVVREVKAEINWSKTPREVWRHPVGTGWSSFSVAQLTPSTDDSTGQPQSRTLLLTQEQRAGNECVVAYDAETGDQIWVHEDPVRFEEPLGGPGPRATPTIDGQRVYSLGATGLLNCLDALTGHKVWATNILKDAKAKNLDWAMAGSPLVTGDAVIVNPGGANGRGVIAYDRLTGDVIWAQGNEPAGYTAPVLATLLGTEQVIVFGGTGPVGHDLETGKELWRFKWENGPKVNAAIPVIVDDSSILISCGYGIGSALLRFSQDGGEWKVASEWESRRLKLKFNAPVRKGDYVYGLDEGILTCVELKTGKPAWKRGRYGYGQLLLCEDVLILQAENSDVVFVDATPDEHTELHRFPTLEGKSWNHPVLWHGRLFVRNGKEAACFDLRLQ